MRKATLNPNTLPNNKGELQIEGFPFANRIIQRDALNSELGTIERPDKTVVASGRTEPGEFNVTLDLADNAARVGYYAWHQLAKDAASGVASAEADVVEGADLYGFDYGNYTTGDNPYLTDSVNERPGIAANYKRKAQITYHRLYAQGSNANGAGAVDSAFGRNTSVRIILHGAWCRSIEFPEYDADGTDGSNMVVTISYDDIQMITR